LQHAFEPRNELLAGIFFKAGYIEAWGRGTVKIIEACRKGNLPEPEFSELTGGFLISFTRAQNAASQSNIKDLGKDGEEVPEKVPEKVTENQSLIIEHMKKKPTITSKNWRK